MIENVWFVCNAFAYGFDLSVEVKVAALNSAYVTKCWQIVARFTLLPCCVAFLMNMFEVIWCYFIELGCGYFGLEVVDGAHRFGFHNSMSRFCITPAGTELLYFSLYYFNLRASGAIPTGYLFLMCNLNV